MLRQLRATIVCFVLMTLLVGGVYPLAVTGIAQVAFPRQANGSLITDGGNIVGSRLLGQEFCSIPDDHGKPQNAKYFWGRISQTGSETSGVSIPYNYRYSGGSNLAPTNTALTDEVRGRIDALHAADPDNKLPIPVDLVTSSGSGLDPDISPAAAAYQVARVAAARAMDPARVRELVAQHTRGRVLGILGEPRVNVLELNLALDQEAARR